MLGPVVNIGHLTAKFQNTREQKQDSVTFQREQIGHIQSIKYQNGFLAHWKLKDYITIGSKW